MADKEQVARLKRSVDEWNLGRKQNSVQLCDLSRAHLSRAHLSGAYLIGAHLSGADLREADLSGARLSGADLREADLSGARLSYANLSYADLSGARLSYANLSYANLEGVNFAGSQFDHTLFVEVDLSTVQELETAEHRGPSIININSVLLPHDEPTRRHFLRGVGFTATQIDYLPSLLTPRPIQYHSLFISYVHEDEVIAKRLYTDLQKEDVPCWFAPHDLRPGIPILRGIEEAIHLRDKFLLILSQHAVNSHWIEREVDAASHQEIRRGRDVLFPIRLDNAVLESNAGWATRLQHRHIGDFTGWQEEQRYQEAFTLLLRHLKTEPSPPHNAPERT